MIHNYHVSSIRSLFSVALILISLFVSAAILSIWALRADAIRDANNDTGNLAAVLSGQLARSIQSVDLILTNIRDSVARDLQVNVGGEQQVKSYAQFLELRTSLSRLSQADAIAVIGKDGRAVNSTSQWPAIGIDVSDREYFKDLKSETADRIYISNLEMSRSTGNRTIFFARRISGPDREFLGVVLIGIQLAYFEGIYSTITAARGQSILLLHPDGKILLRSPDAPVRGDNRMPKESPWHEVAAAGGGSYRSSGYFDFEARYVSVRPLNEYPLILNVAVKETAVLANWRKRAIFIGVGTLLAVVCSTLLLWRVGHQFKRMIKSEATLGKRERSLAERSRDLERLFETASDLIMVTNGSGDLLRVSPVSFSILGYTPEEMIGLNAKELVYEGDLEKTQREMDHARSGQSVRNFEARHIHKNGQFVLLSLSGVWSEADEKYYITGRDVTGIKAIENKLNFLAHFDQLTGLANRASLQNDLDRAFEAVDGRSSPTLVALFDLDGFKNVNDTMGHSTGDRLLQMVAVRLGDLVVGKGQFYRLGGDEFVLLIPDCGDPVEIANSVEVALTRLADRFDINGHQLFVGASAGVAIAPADGATAEEIMSSADLALYEAKAAGGHAYRLFIPQMRAKAQARRVLDSELRKAFANAEFELFFQPQVRANDGRIVGAEALLRWRHPEKGLLAPSAFIDALAESPVVLDVGRWVLRTACELAAKWRAAGFPFERIGVNIFPAQFNSDSLLNDVEAALTYSGLPAQALELEITENTALGDQESVLEAIRTLRAKGVKLAFDDFGTGYASLSYLMRYPLNRLKIDQSFIRKIDAHSGLKETAIVRSLIAMAHNLGLEVIAEGVETEAQVTFLRAEKCEELQGYFFSKPLSSPEFEMWMTTDIKGRIRRLKQRD